MTRLSRAAAGPGPVFAVRGRVAVVLEDDRLAEPFGEELADRQVLPAGQVGRLEQHAGGEVHRPGRAQPDARDPVPGQPARLDRPTARLRQVIEPDLRAELRLRGDAHGRQHAGLHRSTTPLLMFVPPRSIPR